MFATFGRIAFVLNDLRRVELPIGEARERGDPRALQASFREAPI
jgi:hypothetical protein